MSAGGGTTCGIKKNQRLFCWGVNHRGQLGDGTTKPRTRPVVVAKDKKWTSVNAGWFNTCGITAQTQLYCWGDNAAGQIGDGGKAKVRTKPTLVKKGKNWASVSVGSRFVCAHQEERRAVLLGRQPLRPARPRQLRRQDQAGPRGHRQQLGRGLHLVDPHLRPQHQRRGLLLGPQHLRRRSATAP